MQQEKEQVDLQMATSLQSPSFSSRFNPAAEHLSRCCVHPFENNTSIVRLLKHSASGTFLLRKSLCAFGPATASASGRASV